MDRDRLSSLLREYKRGRLTLAQTLHQLKKLPFEDLGFAKIDLHRHLRTGVPEVIYCQGKTPSQIKSIVAKIMEHHTNILATRASQEAYAAISEVTADCEYHEIARLVTIKPRPVEKVGNIAVVCAGTADLFVAEEAAITAERLGNRVERIYDVGVAGLHRLLATSEQLFQANVAVVVAGMEGALASVVGGLVSCPVIAVPTSVGYGASFHGLAALLTMLNSCASGVSVVNIDNGFGAGYQASLINKLATRGSDQPRA